MSAADSVSTALAAARKASDAGRHGEAASILRAQEASADNCKRGLRLEWATLLSEQVRPLLDADEDDAALEAAGVLLAAVQEDQDPEAEVVVMRVLLARWQLLGRRDDHAAAERDVDLILTREWKVPEPKLSEMKAAALYAKGTGHRARGDTAGGVELLIRLVTTYRGAAQPRINLIVARAMADVAAVQNAAGEEAAAQETRQGLIDRFGETEGERLRPIVALAMLKQAADLRKVDPERTLALADRLVAEAQETSTGRVSAIAGTALALVLEIDISRRDAAAANRHAKLLAQRLDRTFPPPELLQRGKLILQTTDLLRQSEAAEDALALSEAVQHAFVGASDPALQAMAVRALINSARALAELGQIPEAMQKAGEIAEQGGPALVALDQMAKTYGGGFNAPEWEAWTMIAKAGVYEEMGRVQEMNAVIRQVDAKFAGSTHPFVRHALAELHRELADGEDPSPQG